MDTKLDDLDLAKTGSKMGICPQFNPLCKNLTVDQCLNLMAEIKGLAKDEIEF